MKRNKFSKALKQLKSTEVDERIKSLEEAAPTNSIGGVYALNQPGQRLGPYDPPRVFYPDVDGNWPDGIPGTEGEKIYTRPAGHWDSGPGSVPAVDWETVQEADFAHSGTSTDGFIDAQTGRVLSDLPPNSRNFILGPLVDGYVYNHGYDDYTNIGYIQKDTRQFVLLARISGYWKSGVSGIDSRFNTNRQWNGSSITIYNSNFTLEMAEWFRDQYNDNRYVKNVSYFYSGGYPQSSNPSAGAPPGSLGGASPGAGGGGGPSASSSAPHGSGSGNPNIGTPQNSPNHGGPTPAGAPFIPKPNPNPPPDNPPPDDPPPDDPWDAEAALRRLEARASWHDYANQKMADRFNTVAAAVLVPLITYGGTKMYALLMALIATYGLSKATEPLIRAKMEAAAKENMDNWGDTLSNADWEKLAERGRQADEAAGKEAREKLEDAEAELKGAEASGNPERIARAKEKVKNAEKNYQRVRANNTRNRQQRSKERRRRGTTQQGGLRSGDPSWGMYNNSFEPRGEVLTESRKRILREIKQPYKMKETPKQKYRMNFKGKFRPQNTPDVTACKQTDEEVKAKNAAGQTWRTKDKHWSRYESQERMNIIYDHVGHGNQYWEMIVNENQNKKGIRDRKIQEQLNIIAHEKAMLREDPNYVSPFRQKIEEQETMQYDNDPLFKKVASRLKKEIDYSDKPSKKGYPDTPPPEMVNGFHPKYGKMYKHDKLDPQSAEAMPPTGNPEIDANIMKARRLKKILGKGG